MPPRVISLFSGAGGMDFGSHAAGFETVLALDNFPAATETFACHFPEADVVTGDIYEFNESKKNPYPKADVLTGGYPCQSFSMGGVRNPSKDDRSNLFLGFAAAVNKIKPKVFIAENVSGLAKLNKGEWFHKQLAVYENELSAKYHVHTMLLNAADYGVPQFRKRVLIVGVRDDVSDSFEFPDPTHTKPKLAEKAGLLPHASHGEAIKHLPPHPAGEYYERPHDPEGNFAWYFMSRNRRHRWDSPAFTVVANFRHITLHPASPKMELEWSDLANGWKQKWRFTTEYDHLKFSPKFPSLQPRRLSWREAAAIQTFPATFSPGGNLEEKFEQIGNAVPPLLMEQIMKQVKKLI
ncbi:MULTISPECIES: DNA cytosine methyltransferase [unclassified Variovorax]|uniref:DNA cytosine methyltransferase n=1 Tax=unclassified Variovorax TaxID=663243 RepID=UPI000A8C7DDC|nr:MULTISPECIES: DNA cytosine methyltransferase [unclassified Variovorax]